MDNYKPLIHKYESTIGGFFVNAFLVETPNGVVAIDATIARSSVNDLRNIIQNKIKKKLLAILLTHGHPDHYTGAGELMKDYGDIPIVATEGTLKQCQARDEEESGYLGSENAFGPEYPSYRPFPNKLLMDNETITFDGVTFRLKQLGPCESDDDNMWLLEDENSNHIFSGDIVYNKMHTFFRDGHASNWQKQIQNCIDTFDHNTIFHGGHGEDMGIEIFHWELGYIKAFIRILKLMLNGRNSLSEDEKNILFSKMQNYLPNEKLLMLTGWQFDEMIQALKADGDL